MIFCQLNLKDMKNAKTPKPGSDEYDVENPQELNRPGFHSSTDKRASHELPALENLNGQETEESDNSETVAEPKTNLGNDRDKDEKDKERIIRR